MSGNQCLEELGASTLDAAEETVARQEKVVDEEDRSEEDVFETTSMPVNAARGGLAESRSHAERTEPTQGSVAIDSSSGEAAASAVADGEERASAVAEVAAVDGNVWFEIAHWAKTNGHLKPWQRSLAYSLGVRKNRELAPTEKQAIQGKRILAEAQRLGFAPSNGRPPGSAASQGVLFN